MAPAKTAREMNVLRGEMKIFASEHEAIIERSASCTLPSPEEKEVIRQKRLGNVKAYTPWFYAVFVGEKLQCDEDEAHRDIRNIRTKLSSEERKKLESLVTATPAPVVNGKKKEKEEVDVKGGKTKGKKREEEGGKKQMQGQWVCCDKCDKWRLVPNDYDLSSFANSKRKWYCSMNPVKGKNKCSAPEDDWDNE
uniref:CW-type domain-containing protein n=1 Tax=Palpitomonas bilix TaxID=652834 RepID=A0A7S3D561_9EUKA|mmetsp:Transcript_22272/g.57301  ORF Transcript_22272/g.57301 Transcript_22272/m.57301 type:complete len:194 (+) Transcript_22272:871-1452(+)